MSSKLHNMIRKAIDRLIEPSEHHKHSSVENRRKDRGIMRTNSRGSRKFFTADDLREMSSVVDGKVSDCRSETQDEQHDEYHDVDSREDDHVTRREKKNSSEDYGIECVLSTLTNDSPQAKDCILPSRAYHAKPKRKTKSSFLSDDSSVVSAWSKSSLVKPLFGSDSKSTWKKYNETSDIKEQSDQMVKKDNPWKAAKRGDLDALKRLHAGHGIDWNEEDECGHIPLYYACASGAIVDISVVPFLLWVTPIASRNAFEKCRMNAINRDVLEILRDYEEGGLSALTEVRKEEEEFLERNEESLSFGKRRVRKESGHNLEKVSLFSAIARVV